MGSREKRAGLARVPREVLEPLPAGRPALQRLRRRYYWALRVLPEMEDAEERVALLAAVVDPARQTPGEHQTQQVTQTKD
jgi:hypothetical protein